MSFAMLCVPDGIFIFALLVLLATGGAGLVLAVFLTVALAKWAAARHNRLAENPK